MAYPTLTVAAPTFDSVSLSFTLPSYSAILYAADNV